jgi:hypothetical protein
MWYVLSFVAGGLAMLAVEYLFLVAIGDTGD